MKMVTAPESDHEINDEEVVPSKENKPEFKKQSSTPRRVDDTAVVGVEYEKKMMLPPFVGQAATKTKIFLPDDSLFNKFTSPSNNNSYCKEATKGFFKTTSMLNRCNDQRSSIIYHDTTERRSAFSVPDKLSRSYSHHSPREYTPSSLLHALQTLPVESDPLLSSSSSPAKSEYRKRVYPFNASQRCEKKTIAYCCCGSHNCKIKYFDYTSDDSEGGESHFSHESTSPPVEKALKPFVMPHRSNHIDGVNVDYLNDEEYAIRRELKELRDHRDQEQNHIFILKSNVGSKFDPFMGYKDSAPVVEDLFNVNGYQ